MKIYTAIVAYLLSFCSFAEIANNPINDLEKPLIVGTSGDNPPYEFFEKGEIKGFDIDLIVEIAKVLNKKILIKNMDFTSLVPALKAKKVDLIIAGISETPTRSKNVTFSCNYTHSNMALLLRKGLKVQNLHDLENKTIGAQTGSTWQATALDLSEKIKNLKIKTLASNLFLVEELKAGKIDAVILEKPQVVKFATINKLSTFDLKGYSKPLSIVLQKEDLLVRQINLALEELKDKGFIDYLHQKWLE